MNRVVSKLLLLLFIDVMPKIEKLFGLSELSFRNKRFKVLTLSSRAMAISFVAVYPISCFKLLDFFSHKIESGVSTYARNLTFGFNWLLLLFILGSRALNNNSRQRDIQSMLRKLIELQSLSDNLILLIRCTLKDAVIFAILFRLTYGKYSRHYNSNLGVYERHLWVFLFLPIVTMTLASNRIYVDNAVVKHFLMKIVSDLKLSAPNRVININYCAINYSRVHRAFTRSSRKNGINLLVVLSYCSLHIVYEVEFRIHNES